MGKSVDLNKMMREYADNDTTVLPILYRSLDQLTKETLDANIDKFLTAGSMAWYGFLSNLPDGVLDVKRTSSRNVKGADKINTKLYRCELG